MRKRIYYKVVTNELKSIVQHDRGLGIQYKINEYVSPLVELLSIGYGLTVFSSIEHAKKAIENNWWEDCQIWSCHIKDVLEVGVPCMGMPSYYEKFVQYYNYLKQSIEEHSGKDYVWPKGTIMTNGVKLLKIIEDRTVELLE